MLDIYKNKSNIIVLLNKYNKSHTPELNNQKTTVANNEVNADAVLKFNINFATVALNYTQRVLIK